MRITNYVNRHGTKFLRPDKGVPLTMEDILMERVNREDEAIIYEVPLPKFKGEKKQSWSKVAYHVFAKQIISFLQP